MWCRSKLLWIWNEIAVMTSFSALTMCNVSSASIHSVLVVATSALSLLFAIHPHAIKHKLNEPSGCGSSWLALCSESDSVAKLQKLFVQRLKRVWYVAERIAQECWEECGLVDGSLKDECCSAFEGSAPERRGGSY